MIQRLVFLVLMLVTAGAAWSAQEQVQFALTVGEGDSKDRLLVIAKQDTVTCHTGDEAKPVQVEISTADYAHLKKLAAAMVVDIMSREAPPPAAPKDPPPFFVGIFRKGETVSAQTGVAPCEWDALIRWLSPRIEHDLSRYNLEATATGAAERVPSRP